MERINLEIKQSSEQTAELVALEATRTRKFGEKHDYESRIKDFESRTKIDSIVNELTVKLGEKREKRRNIESALTRLNIIVDGISQVQSLNQLIQSFNNEFTDSLSLKKFETISEEGLTLLSNSVQENRKSLNDQLERINAEILEVDNQFKSLQDSNRIISDFKQKEMLVIEEIQRIDLSIANLKSKEMEITRHKDKLFLTSAEIIKYYVNQANFLSSHITANIPKNQDELLQAIDFTVETRVNVDSYYEQINDLIDNRYVSKETLKQKVENELVSKINGLILNPAADQAMLKSAFDSIQVNLEKSLVTSADKYDLRNSLFKIPLYIAINVKFDGIPIENLSMGQRAIVLLQIILAYDKTPLLIDQPEEALDNKYIYEKLVTVLRKAKKNRQIIIVTHNANLVVNTDSEQVIVAENNDNEISYSVGTIEDPDTQERIKSILEGGKEAFEKREQKYGYIRK